LSIEEKKTTYGKLWTSLCQYPELLAQIGVEYSRFVCNNSSPRYRIFILTTPDEHVSIIVDLLFKMTRAVLLQGIDAVTIAAAYLD